MLYDILQKLSLYQPMSGLKNSSLQIKISKAFPTRAAQALRREQPRRPLCSLTNSKTVLDNWAQRGRHKIQEDYSRPEERREDPRLHHRISAGYNVIYREMKYYFMDRYRYNVHRALLGKH